MEDIRRVIQAPQFRRATRDKITWPEKWKQRKEQATSSILERDCFFFLQLLST